MNVKSIAARLREICAEHDPSGNSEIRKAVEDLIRERAELELDEQRELTMRERYCHLKAQGIDKIHMSGISGYIGEAGHRAFIVDSHNFLDRHGAPRHNNEVFERKE